MKPTSVIRRPLVTEKTTIARESSPVVVFEVAAAATKIDVKRAVEKGETQGFIKIVVDAETDRILGAAILGTGGDEVVHSIIDVMYAKAPYTLIKRAVHIHPTVSELLPTTLWSLQPL